MCGGGREMLCTYIYNERTKSKKVALLSVQGTLNLIHFFKKCIEGRRYNGVHTLKKKRKEFKGILLFD